MRAAVLGVGALGGRLGWELQTSGAAKVTLAVRRPAQAAALREQGLTLLDTAGRPRGTCFPHVVTAGERSPVQDVVFVATKAYAAAAALTAFASLVGPNTLVVSLQNGLGVTAELQRALPPQVRFPVVRCVTANGATRLCDTVVRLGGSGWSQLGWTTTVPAAADERLSGLAHVLTAAGWPTQVVPDISPYEWGKLLVNVGINPLTALLGQPNAIVVTNTWAHRTMQFLIKEAASVASRLGIALPWRDALAAVKRVATDTAQNRSSMLQDLEAGRPTEIDYINGAVVRYGQKVAVPTPYNRLIVALIKAREELVLGGSET